MSEANAIISPRLAIGLVIVSALSALAFLVLSAYAPDLRSDASSDATAVSKSAIGFAGLRVLLGEDGIATTVGRTPPRKGAFSLVVLTPQIQTEPKEIARLTADGPRLIVLPKWIAIPDPLHKGWVRKAGGYQPQQLGLLLAPVAKGSKVAQRRGTASVHLKALQGLALALPAKALWFDQLQTVAGPDLVPLLADDTGKAVLARIDKTQFYILADPDLLDDTGLRDADMARAGLGIVQALRVGTTPVSLDVTLDGLGHAPDLLRVVFAPPFLGATLCVLLAAAFLAFHAMSRFGAPVRPDRVYAFGKRALADNTAAVIRIMRREPAMAPRYAQALLNQVIAFFGIPREKAADPAVIGALEARSAVAGRFADLRAEAGDARDVRALMQVAAKLYRWRRGITHGHL